MDHTKDMKVTVIDRKAMSHFWGIGIQGVVLKKIDIADECPECGGPRGNPCPHRQHEDGDWFTVDRWNNPCGHVDMYSDVIAEGEQRVLQEA